MKNIFKKNHIIISALLIMIVIAGYLSFTNRDKDATVDKDVATVANPDTDEYGEFTEVDGLEVVTDTTDMTDATTEDTTDTADGDTDAATTDVTADGTLEEAAPAEADAGDLGQSDISDEDALASAKDVTDNGELDLEEGVPGEAVLANAAIDASFFISHKIDREQLRAQNKADLYEMIESDKISDDLKKDAIAKMIELTENAEKENAAETLLAAKGFDGAIVLMVNGQADVIINAENLSDQQLAIIEDVVKSKTELSVKNIHIAPVVISE